MPRYALHYFARGAAVRPYDARMWCAMGQCYEVEQARHPPFPLSSPTTLPPHTLPAPAVQTQPSDGHLPPPHGPALASAVSAVSAVSAGRQLLNLDAAERCYKRALACGDREGLALARLAKLLEQGGRQDEAAQFYKMNLVRCLLRRMRRMISFLPPQPQRCCCWRVRPRLAAVHSLPA